MARILIERIEEGIDFRPTENTEEGKSILLYNIWFPLFTVFFQIDPILRLNSIVLAKLCSATDVSLTFQILWTMHGECSAHVPCGYYNNDQQK